MKHLINFIRILFVFLIQLLAMITGIFIVPFALLLNRIEPFDPVNQTSRPNHRFKDKWIDFIWGNNDDGIDGDVYYLKDHTDGEVNFFTRVNWVLFRNPVHNLGLYFGFNGAPVKHIGFRIPFNNSKCSKKEFNNDYDNCLDSDTSKQGFEYTEVYDKTNKKYMMYRLRWKYPFSNLGIKANIGWKNWNVNKKCIGTSCSYTFTFLINFFKKFK